MAFEKLPLAEVKSDDHPKMKEAIKKLKEHGHQPRRATRYQLKVNELISYYPTKGTIFMDRDDVRRPEKGLDELPRLLDCPPGDVLLRIDLGV